MEYARTSKIDYLADWHPMADRVKVKSDPPSGKEFGGVAGDERANLGVLRRIRRTRQ